MAPSRTKTVKNKHASNGSGIRGSKDSSRKAPMDGIVKSKRKPTGKSGGGGGSVADILKKRNKKKVYSEKELDIPELNTITPVGVQKPKGKKKGKVFVDDRESMNTILAMVQADKEGEIESKMIKARKMEEIREARKVETEKKEQERKAKLEQTKESLRKRRKRSATATDGESDKAGLKDVMAMGTKAGKPKKRVAFA